MAGGFKLLVPETTPKGVRTSNESVKAEMPGGERGQAGQASDRPKQHGIGEGSWRGDGITALEAEGLCAGFVCRRGRGFARGIRTRSIRRLHTGSARRPRAESSRRLEGSARTPRARSPRGLRCRSLVRRLQARRESCAGDAFCRALHSRSLRVYDTAGGDGGRNRHNRGRSGRRRRHLADPGFGTGIRNCRKKRYPPMRSPERQRGQKQEDEEGHRPEAMANLGGLPPNEPGEHEAGRQDHRRPDHESRQRPRFDHPWEGHHRPSSEASSIIAMIRSRSSALSVLSSSASNVATAPSTEPPKKVLSTCRIAPRRARTTGTRGE